MSVKAFRNLSRKSRQFPISPRSTTVSEERQPWSNFRGVPQFRNRDGQPRQGRVKCTSNPSIPSCRSMASIVRGINRSKSCKLGLHWVSMASYLWCTAALAVCFVAIRLRILVDRWQVFTHWLCFPCAGENSAINTIILTKPVSLVAIGLGGCNIYHEGLTFWVRGSCLTIASFLKRSQQQHNIPCF